MYKFIDYWFYLFDTFLGIFYLIFASLRMSSNMCIFYEFYFCFSLIKYRDLSIMKVNIMKIYEKAIHTIEQRLSPRRIRNH